MQLKVSVLLGYAQRHWMTDARHSRQLQITANKMQLFLNLFIFTDALHVSGGSSAHHHEHITAHTASGIGGGTA